MAHEFVGKTTLGHIIEDMTFRNENVVEIAAIRFFGHGHDKVKDQFVATHHWVEVQTNDFIPYSPEQIKLLEIKEGGKYLSTSSKNRAIAKREAE